MSQSVKCGGSWLFSFYSCIYFNFFFLLFVLILSYLFQSFFFFYYRCLLVHGFDFFSFFDFVFFLLFYIFSFFLLSVLIMYLLRPSLFSVMCFCAVFLLLLVFFRTSLICLFFVAVCLQ